MLHNQRRLTTLEPSVDFAVLLLTLVTSSRCLAMPGRRATTNALLVMDCPLGVRQAAEDGSRSSLVQLHASEAGR